MENEVLQIQLRQMDVKGANARHYFWVLAKMKPGNKFTVLQELHGFPADWKTGSRKSFSLGGDQLKTFRYRKPRFYNESRKLPYEIANTGFGREILPIWNNVLRAGELVNRRNFSYAPLEQNSNSAAAFAGLMMDKKVRRIGDPSINPVHTTVPGLTTELFPGMATLKQHSGTLKPLGGVGFIDEFGIEPDPFDDDFRDDIPFQTRAPAALTRYHIPHPVIPDLIRQLHASCERRLADVPARPSRRRFAPPQDEPPTS